MHCHEDYLLDVTPVPTNRVATSANWIYSSAMAQQYRRASTAPTARLPELFFSISASMVGFTGAWLWWFGENIRNRVIRENDITDPYAVQLWMRRLHTFGTWLLVAVVVLMIIRAALRQQGWRMMFLFAFLVFIGIGVWAGYDTDWDAARLWSETIGTKLSAGLNLDGGPELPDQLQSARVHLSIIPAALAAVGLISFLHYRRD